MLALFSKVIRIIESSLLLNERKLLFELFTNALLNDCVDEAAALAIANEAWVNGKTMFCPFWLLALLFAFGAPFGEAAKPFGSLTLFNENVLFILRSELIVGLAHDGGRTTRVARLVVLLFILLLLFWYRLLVL